MKQRMKTAVLVLVPLVLGLIFSALIAGCSSCESGPKGGAIDACALLAEVNPEALLGEPVKKAKKIIDQHNADSDVSMCGVSARGPGLKSVSLHVMYAKNYTNPKTAAEYLEGKDFGSVGMKPREIHGPGDVALSFSTPGVLMLQVFWKKHYRMKVSFTGLGDNARTLEKAKSVARHVMDKL